jgi:hypothetical protein
MDRDLNPGISDYELLLIQVGILLADLKASRALKSYLVSSSNNPYRNFCCRKITTNAVI